VNLAGIRGEPDERFGQCRRDGTGFGPSAGGVAACGRADPAWPGGCGGVSRSTVSLAEIGRQSQARDFWEACDKALDTGGVLTAGADQIGKVRDAEQRAAALAAQEAREARALAALAAAQRHSGVSAGVTGVQACPHCGGEVTVLTTLIPETRPAREALRQQG
jgi:hypothetical protein